MQKPEWTKIGTVEVCIGTDGVIGLYISDRDVVVRVNHGGTSMYSVGSKEMFERYHCLPPKPRHSIRHYADGSCVVESTEQDEQGRPLRCAIVREGIPVTWVVNWKREWEESRTKKDAIARAVRYVETGE